jgi:hypothetical protein
MASPDRRTSGGSRGAAGVIQQVVFEDLDAVEAGGGDGFEFLWQGAAQGHGGDRTLHGGCSLLLGCAMNSSRGKRRSKPLWERASAGTIDYSQVKSPRQCTLYETVSFCSITEQNPFRRIDSPRPVNNHEHQSQARRPFLLPRRSFGGTCAVQPNVTT